MTEFFDADRETQVDYWTTQRSIAACALRVANERLAELGVIEPLHEVEALEPENVHQLKLAVPEDGAA